MRIDRACLFAVAALVGAVVVVTAAVNLQTGGGETIKLGDAVLIAGKR